MSNLEKERTTAAGYDFWAASYDDTDPSTWLDEPFLLKHIDPFPGCRILDIGCGTGRYLRLLTPSRYRVIGIDLSRRMLERAKHRFGSRSDIRLLQASAGALPFTPCSFDRIMSGLVIDHVASAEQWFRQISGLLRTDGRAVVAAVHPEMQRLTGWDIEIRNGADEAIHIPGHLHEVAPLLAAARDAGLALVAMEEPRVTAAMLQNRPAWSGKIGRCALLLIALRKT
jgi:ubiquinone/menaquinone biosynthesis C-methylase UbiE